MPTVLSWIRTGMSWKFMRDLPLDSSTLMIAGGVPQGECSDTRPFYCEKGELVEGCEICECYPYSICQENGSCQYTKTGYNQPPAFADLENKEVMECGKETFPSLALFGAIVFVLASLYLIADHYKKKRELRKLSRYELHEVIKGYMYRGFTKPEIRKVLRSKGYTTKEIKELMREVEKEAF
jgi:hypothetical protein